MKHGPFPSRVFLPDRRGNIATLAALCAPVVLIAAAIAVDEGAIFNEQRALQNHADLAAISAAAHPANAAAAALRSLGDNGLPAGLGDGPGDGSGQTLPDAGALVSVVAGHYSDSASIVPAERFKAGGKPINAFQVEVSRKGTLYFSGGLIDAPTLRGVAIGHAAPEAAFSIGSRLARLNGGVANKVLGSLVGGEVALSAMDYDALLDARIGVFDLLDAVKPRLQLTAATYDEVASADVPLPVLLDAAAATPGLGAGAKAALHRLAVGADRRLALSLGSLFDLGAAGASPLGTHAGSADASVGLMEMASGAAALASGKHQVEADLGAALPGIVGARLSLAIGEREQTTPSMRIGKRDSIVRTAQTRFLLDLKLAGPGGALGTTIALPLYGEVAYAEAQLGEITCTPGQSKPARVSVSARPGVAELRIAATDARSLGEWSRKPAFGQAVLVDTKLARISGSALAAVGNVSADALRFAAREIGDGTAKSVSTRDIAKSLTKSLLEDLKLTVGAGPLTVGLPDGGLGSSLKRALEPVAGSIDSLVGSVLAVTGVSIGEADVRVSGGICNRAVLVQ